MTGRSPLPLLYLDIDGPLLPFGGTPREHPARHHVTPAVGAAANPLLARIDPALGPRLAALPCELVWATTWMADANTDVAPRIGLPYLPVLDPPELSEEQQRADERRGLHWKTRALVGRAGGRPFAWVDDEITAADRAWVAAHHAGPALLHRVDPRAGLTDADFAALDHWLRGAGTARG
ncbi:HAD domain-containing protein [Kitasatospora herbaricolor]|uniref:HAD domain-containing protein n=1 Tax=Kitasatospora herbaricolor TaxID=68217 RepID=A0ABZ1W0V0_9ACTN|nr:HAD domain-containing protein [Kitasatospora herbaricolor]